MSDSGKPETNSCKDTEEDEDVKPQISRLECTNKDVALPLNCFICQNPFSDPVVTKCQHYFCKNCALKHHTKNIRCFVCNEPTLGVFNTAVEIKKRIYRECKEAKDHMKELSPMIDKVSTLADSALDVAGKVVKIVDVVDKLVYKALCMTKEAELTAVKAVKMVQEARATTEIADANIAKAVEKVEEVETLVKKAVSMATEAGKKAVKSTEMVNEAWAMVETAKDNLTER